MSERTTSGNDFQLHEALKNTFSATTNGNTYTISNGVDSWHFEEPSIEHGVHFGEYLASFVTAIYQAGLRSSGNPSELGEPEADQLVVFPDEETKKLAGNSRDSIVPGTAFNEREDVPPPEAKTAAEFPEVPDSKASTSTTETPPAPKQTHGTKATAS